MKPRLIFLAGPTASGKTEASLVLAARLHAEIISCDSMQVYKGMDILTSKPSRQSRKRIPHYMVDFVPLAKDYDVSQFRREALAKASMILKRGKAPLFVGGTGLYMTLLVDGIFEMKTEDAQVRERLYRAAARRGSTALHERLKRVDPIASRKIHPNDTRRLVRALEVYEVTGKPITELQKMRTGLERDYEVRIFCLDVDRDELYRRINGRVDRMFRQGVAGEVRRCAGKKLSRTAAAAIGMAEIRDYLAGRSSLDEAKERIKQATRNYARRQLTWFRKDKRIQWIPVQKNDTAAAVCVKIQKALK
jgi:tRNA dimethylallyltransferase